MIILYQLIMMFSYNFSVLGTDSISDLISTLFDLGSLCFLEAFDEILSVIFLTGV